MNTISLKYFKKDKSIRGRNLLVFILWEITNFFILKNWLCTSYSFKRFILRLFGAKLGKDVIIKQGVNIKYPWKLKIGDYSWIGEEVWIDNIENIEIGANVCISQGVYLCTGNHDWDKKHFPLVAKGIVIEEGVWIGAKAIICPGIKCRSHSVLTIGSMAVHNLEPYKVYQGNPAVCKKDRVIND